MKVIYSLTYLYIFIIIIQYLIINYSVYLDKYNEIEEKINYNIRNKNKLTNNFTQILQQRIDLLTSNKMDYKEWFNYNNQNIIHTVDNHKYYFFVYEKMENNDNFICKSHANQSYINLSWSDILKDNVENLVFTKYTTDKNLISNMYGSSNTSKGTDIMYYWVDALTSKLVSKQSRVIRWYDNNNNKSGVIGIGFDIEDLDDINKFNYYDKIIKIYPILISLLTYFISIMLYKLKNTNEFYYKPFLFLIATNIYILYFLIGTENIGSSSIEIQKEENIGRSILSVSFLVGINVFILTSLQQSFKRDLFIESGFVFAFSIILLLFSIFKSTSYITVNQIISIRLSQQFIFNFAILLNTLIVINYIFYILSFRIKKMLTK
jgi:hypothetical protein